MKKQILSLVMGFIFVTGNVAAAASLQNGTPISVKLTNSVSSSSSDAPNFVVATDVKDSNGNLLIKEGTLVLTEYSNKKKRSVGLPGQVDIKFISTTSSDGQLISLSGSKQYKAEDKKGKVIGVAVGVGWFIWPMLAFLAKKGDDVELGPSTLMNAATVMGNYSIK
jgi:hypothetical protein